MVGGIEMNPEPPNASPAKPIPIPWSQRWAEARVRYIPAAVFVGVVLLAALLWKDYASAPTLVGQAEAMAINVSSYKPGMLAQLNVTRFQKVKLGDEIGQVLVTDPKILESSLALIQAQIEELRASLTPLADQQRLAMEYSEIRLHWMSQRAQLGEARANLQVAQADFRRIEQLFKDKIVSERDYDAAKAKQDSLANEVDELARSVQDQGQRVAELQPTNSADISKVTDESLRAAIAVQESKLHLTEAELRPVVLRATADGMVDVILHHAGEAVTAGEPIVQITPYEAVRIVGYLRPPVLAEPKAGARVEVRTRGTQRQIGSAQILEVGAQFEPLAPALQMPSQIARNELGLPLSISVPANLKIRPGELVDLRLLPAAN